MAVRRLSRRGKDSPIYEMRTRDILVRIIVSYLPDESRPEEGRWVWAYMAEIENHGSETVQLVSRHWIITDAANVVEEVKGEGVVGEQPTLLAREAFRYTSGCALSTASGTMRGTFQMLTEGGVAFEAEIPEFSLHLPGAQRKMN
ncbi:MAG: Co2+/Mg2+ efflux protein ApaG [Caulobacter sp.]|nr:Co2+/Mg2+ efflux protein ApaG [Caulobacter sp.]